MSLDIIKLLPDSVANQIAAGEVIQRPASVVKELIENSIDAGATQIGLVVKDAGRAAIIVSDNGCGMSVTDARLCFERHATSKLRCADDLFKIRTMGFRGEALASIAAIAQVELSTRRKEDEVGVKVIVEGSVVKDQSVKPMSVGTTISVKNIFFNVPARRNFLKSNEAELRHITEEFFRITMMNPDIAFTFSNNEKELYHLYPGTLKQRLVGLYGKDYNERLLPVTQETDSVSVNGFVAKPEFAKKTRGDQYFFVNKRFIKHSYLNHAVENAFSELLPQDCFPSYFLNIEIDPKEIDINIHPTKTEVNFLNVKLVYAIIHAAVRKAVGQHNLAPLLDFDANPNLGIDFGEASRMDKPIVEPKINLTSNYNPFKINPSQSQRVVGDDWRMLYEEPETTAVAPKEESMYLQVCQSYIVTHVKSGLLVIDQHLAHERILYEKYIKQLESKAVASQQELFPNNMTLNSNDASLLKEIMPDLENIGFRISQLGGNTFVINGTPSDLGDEDAVAAVEKILDSYKTFQDVQKLDAKVNIARATAAQLSIKSGKSLTAIEMQDIVDRLFACTVAEVSPSGKKIYIILNVNDLKKLFD